MTINTKPFVVDYGRRTFVFGLSWFSPFEDDTPAKSAADTIKRSHETYDLVLIRNDDAPQFSIAKKEHGVKSGAISAAAALCANLHLDSWLYAMEIDGKIWICNGSNSHILPDGDQIYDDHEEAKEAFLKLEPSRWKSISVPQSWKLAGSFSEEKQRFFVSSEVKVSDQHDVLSVNAQKWMRLKPQSPTSDLAKIAGIVSTIALMVYFGKGFMFPTPEPYEPTQNIVTAEMLAERARIQTQSVYDTYDSVKPWASAPRVQEFATACMQAMNEIPVIASGYQAVEINCQQGSAIATMVKGENTYASWLQEWSKSNTDFDVDISQDGLEAFLISDIPPLNPRGEDDFKNYSYAASILMETASIEGSKVSISDPVIYHYEEHPDYVPLYGTSQISVDTKRPSAWFASFTKAGGVVIDTITLNPATMSYQLKGKIYVTNR